MQPRYDEERGIYRDCKWCGGKGCLSCPYEAEAEYKRQLPNGPQPIASLPLTEETTEKDIAAFIAEIPGLPSGFAEVISRMVKQK